VEEGWAGGRKRHSGRRERKRKLDICDLLFVILIHHRLAFLRHKCCKTTSQFGVTFEQRFNALDDTRCIECMCFKILKAVAEWRINRHQSRAEIGKCQRRYAVCLCVIQSGVCSLPTPLQELSSRVHRLGHP